MVIYLDWNCYHCHYIQTDSEAVICFFQYIAGVFVQWPEHEADYFLPSGAETKNAAVILFLYK